MKVELYNKFRIRINAKHLQDILYFLIIRFFKKYFDWLHFKKNNYTKKIDE